ncbi:hypothetical protein PYW07_001742 [Mythimna separata]|uniref:SCP domain-containing protein n=1 Tax=Mythimna separata TaxID=271217 RepID=A0AAD8DWC9_MYTSE|nr:hypothetical protein PYW07_001742 [Mythimna separata]
MVAITMKSIVLFLFLSTSVCCFKHAVSLSCEEIRAFVDGHNTYRHRVARGEIAGQPPASDMKMMVWDEELAAKASQWAKRNLRNHNPDKTVRSNRFTVGESMHWYATTDLEAVLKPESVLKSWFSEHVNYTFGPLKRSDFQKEYHIGHYTQMVWSNSVYVGCGISKTTNSRMNKFFTVCNYGPGGNYMGEKPYKVSSGRNNKLICDAQEKCDNPYGSKCG